jgi:hypothetical protein
MTEIADINRALELIHVADPLVDWDEPEPLLPKSYQALALMYSNEVYRSYLDNMYRQAVKTAALKTRNDIEAAFAKAQALTYKKLLIDAKKAFQHLDKLKLIKQKKHE